MKCRILAQGAFMQPRVSGAKPAGAPARDALRANECPEIDTPVLARAILRSVAAPGGATLVDYGCGVGCLARAILAQDERVRVIGVGASELQLRLAQEYVASERFSISSLAELRGPVDAVYSVHALERLSPAELGRVVRRFYELLAPEGVLFLCPSSVRVRWEDPGRVVAPDDGGEVQRALAPYFEPEGDLFAEGRLACAPRSPAPTRGSAWVFRRSAKSPSV